MVPASNTVVAVRFVLVAFVDVRFVSTAVVALRFVEVAFVASRFVTARFVVAKFVDVRFEVVMFTEVKLVIRPVITAAFVALKNGAYEKALTTLTPSLYTQATVPAGTVTPVPAAVLTTISSAQSFWTMYGFSIEGTTRLRIDPPVVPVQRRRKLRAV
jgi:hypothetical protein